VVALKMFLSEISPDGKAQDEVAISCCLDHPNLTRVKALVFDGRDRWPMEDSDDYEDEGADGAVQRDGSGGLVSSSGGGGGGNNGSSTAGGGSKGDGGKGDGGKGEAVGRAAGAGGADHVAHAHAHEAARGLVLQLVKGKPLASKPTSEHLLRCK